METLTVACLSTLPNPGQRKLTVEWSRISRLKKPRLALSIALGVIGLTWGDFASVWQPVPAAVYGRGVLAYTAATLFLAAGIALQCKWSRKVGALLLAALYLLFALLWVRRVIGFPQIFGTWGGFAEQLALVAAGFITYAGARVPGGPRALRFSLIGRVIFGLCAVAFGLNHFFALPQTAAMVPKWLPPTQLFWAFATGVCHVLAGIAIVSGVQGSLAARLLTAMFIVFGALVWVPALLSHPADHTVWAGNAINLALVGAAWVIADAISALAGFQPRIAQRKLL